MMVFLPPQNLLAAVLLVLMTWCGMTSANPDPAPPMLTPSTSFPVSGTNCCMKIPNHKHLGLNAEGTREVVDVGECVNVCYGWVSGFAGLRQCNGECYAKRTAMEIHHLLTGDREVSVIRSCRCGSAGRCRRLRKQVVYFPGTEFETQVDVGQCSSDGGCGQSEVCQPVILELKTIPTPNGVRSVPVVSGCKCVGGCYLLPHYQEVTFPGMQAQGEEEGEGERGGESGAVGQGDIEVHQKMVDIGRCAGKCPQQEPQCIPSQHNPAECQITLTPLERPCLPVAMEPVEIMTDRNHTETIRKVSQCGCGQ